MRDRVVQSPRVTELSSTVAHLFDVMEQERCTLTRVLHDDLGGLLVSSIMDLGWIEQHVASTPELRERLKRVRTALAAAVDLKRSIIEDLRPSLLDNFGLFAASRWHVKQSCKRAGLQCTERFPVDELALRPAALAGLFRIMQETLAVILSETSLKSIDVTVSIDADTLVLTTAHAHEVEETTDVYESRPTQMHAIAERVNGLNGCLTIARATAATTIDVSFPVSALLAG